MPVRQLDYFLADRRLVQTSPLHLLRDTRLGIDGHHWLRRVLLQSTKEPAAAAMGGTPNGLRAALEKDLNQFKAHGIQPLVIFHGITVPRKERAFSTEDLRPAKRASAWDAYDKGRVEQANSGWSASGGIAPLELVQLAMKVLHEHQVEYMRAPYGNWAQLIYLEQQPEQPIHAIYGSTELLMFAGVDRVITAIDFDKSNTFGWLSKRAVLHDLQLTEEQLLDVCILAGCDYCSTCPIMTADSVNFQYKAVVELVRQYRTGYNAVQAFHQHPEMLKARYEEIYCRVRTVIRHHLILATDGTVQPLPSSEPAPIDLHECMGPRLPDRVYTAITQNLVAPQVVNTLVSGQLVEQAPLCNGESQEYRTFIDQLSPIRSRTIALLTTAGLHNFYRQRAISCTAWFEPNVDRPLDHTSESPAGWSHWYVPQEAIESEMSEQRVSCASLQMCLKMTSTNAAATAKTIGSRPADQSMTSKDEIVADTLFQMLEHRNFLTTKHTPTIFGRALLQAMSLAPKPDGSSHEHQSELFLALELLRLNALHGDPFSKSYLITSAAVTDDVKVHLRLISRVMTLLQMAHRPTPWHGPLNREILAFSSFAKALGRTLRTLCEAILLRSQLLGHIRRAHDDPKAIHHSLPFHSDANTGLGILIKTYLEDAVQKPVTDKKAAAEEALKHAEETFTGCPDVKAEVLRAFRFWDQLMTAIRTLKTENALQEPVYQQFNNTDQWLAGYRV